MANKNLLDIIFLAIISTIFLFLMSFDINSWYYSVLGDEYRFYEYAADIANGGKKISVFPKSGHVSLLDQRGVYGLAPVSTSAYQASTMKLFGISHQGWILSSILSVILSFWPMFFSLKEIFGRKTALLSTVIFSSSHYLWAFTHTGYWNIQGFFFPLVSVFLLVKGLKTKNSLFFCLSGISSGLCFYTNYFARITFFLVLLYFVLSRQFKSHLKGFSFYLLGFLVLFITYLKFNSVYFLQPMMERSIFNMDNTVSDNLLIRLGKNLWISTTAFFSNNKSDHFVSGSLVDPISALLITLGLILILIRPKKYYFLFISFILTLLMVGGFSPYTDVAITRLFFLLPFLSLFAGLGLINISEIIARGIPKRLEPILIVLSLTSVILLNLNRFYQQTPKKIPVSEEKLTMKALELLPKCRKSSLIVFRFPEPVFYPMLSSYGILNNFEFLKNLNDLKPTANNKNCIILSDASTTKENLDTIKTILEGKWEYKLVTSESDRREITVLSRK